MHKDTAIIIPALEKNRYSQDGDLVRFGDLSLLEWKITQVKNFINPECIFVATPSAKIEKIVKSYGANVIRRKEEMPMSEVTLECAKKAGKDIIVWTHVTSPFVGGSDFSAMLEKFLKVEGKHDSLIAVYQLREFIIFRNKALNFEMTKVTERKAIDPAYRITNGCFVARKETYLKYGNYFGTKPFLYELDSLASMEIKDMKDLAIASDLVSLFFRKELNV